MPSIIILDTGPLSNAAVAPRRHNVPNTLSQQCRDWINACEGAGLLLLVPAIVYYEALREIERRNAAGQRERLRKFVFTASDRYLPLTTLHLEEAARLWGAARRSGIPTASDQVLDADIILCAQVLSLGLFPTDYVVATTNVRHLSRFVNCEEWTNIKV